MEENAKPKNPLLYDEDWWTVWFGMFIIVVATILGFLQMGGVLPKFTPAKLGSWGSNPMDAFYSAKKKAIKISPAMTVTDVVKKINDAKLNISATLEPRDFNNVMVIRSTRSGAGQTIKVKATLKQGQLLKFTAKDKDSAGLGAMTYISQEFNSTAAVIGVGTLEVAEERAKSNALSVFLALILIGLVCSVGIKVMGEDPKKFLSAYAFICLITVISLLVQGQTVIKAYGLGYAFWALLIGLIISNTIGTPKAILHAVKTEMYIKTGLVLLGAEILFGKIISLGIPGLMVAWIVTPTVVIFMYFFGTKVLKITRKPLVIIIAMATSVCGVSAAIAAAAASRAKKEELTLGVGMTLIFTVIMMIFMPLGIKAMGMDPILGGAWIGGTIDSTGAVVASGAMLGADAETVAAVVKMIQNILIGVMGFIIAVLWVTRVDRDPNAPKPRLIEIWTRFPKFIVGFVAASILFSFILCPICGKFFGTSAAIFADGLPLVENNVLKAFTNPLRGLFFCLAFVSIGLESNFRDLASQLVGGKPIILYIVGQSFNLALTLFVAWIAFMKLFPNAI